MDNIISYNDLLIILINCTHGTWLNINADAKIVINMNSVCPLNEKKILFSEQNI